jgi:hypothetical protein
MSKCAHIEFERYGVRGVLTTESERWWSIDVNHFVSKKHFLRYAGRYVRRPLIAQYCSSVAQIERSGSGLRTKSGSVDSTLYTPKSSSLLWGTMFPTDTDMRFATSDC